MKVVGINEKYNHSHNHSSDSEAELCDRTSNECEAHGVEEGELASGILSATISPDAADVPSESCTPSRIARPASGSSSSSSELAPECGAPPSDSLSSSSSSSSSSSADASEGGSRSRTSRGSEAASCTSSSSRAEAEEEAEAAESVAPLLAVTTFGLSVCPLSPALWTSTSRSSHSDAVKHSISGRRAGGPEAMS